MAMNANIIINNTDVDRVEKRIEFERDPVCGDMIMPEKAKGISIYKNSRYYFCCPVCKKNFDNNPSAYADKEEGYYEPDNPNDFLYVTFRIL